MMRRILSSSSSLFGVTLRTARLFLVLVVFHGDYFGCIVFLNKATGLAVGTDHACVLLDNGSIKCFGANGYGQLGYGDTVARGRDSSTMGDNLNAIDLGSDVSRVVAMSAGIAHTCVIFDEGVLKCFGRNNRGQLGLGDNNHRGDEEDEMGDFLPAVPLGTNRTAVAVVAEGYRTCVLLDNGKVRCWGDGEFGALGSGDELNTGDGDEIADSVDLGENTVVSAIGRGPCAIFEDGSLSCWGKGYYGQNGQGTMDNVGDDEGEMGAALGTVPLGTGSLVRAVVAGRDYSCALFRSGDWGMKCWGRGEGGQLGSEGIATVGDDPDEMDDMLPLVDLGTKAKVVEVAAGEQHTCAILSSGAVKCWGRNFYGNLGLEDIRARGHKPDTMGSALPEVDLGADRTAVSIGAGGERTCAILDNGELKCWGGNADGQLGLGDTQARGLAEGEMGDQLPPVALGTNRTAVALFANVWTLPPTPAPTFMPTPQPTSLPTPQPTPSPTLQPTLEPTPQPTSSPTLQPVPLPTPQPTPSPTIQPTPLPTPQPTSSPTIQPTPLPTPQPTSSPTIQPTPLPMLRPTSSPTLQPMPLPTLRPTSSPTLQPTPLLTLRPTSSPSSPTLIPTFQPTSSPALVPTLQPTSSPTLIPALQLMTMPTITLTPTTEIGQHASEGPSVAPTVAPSSAPSPAPSSALSAAPTSIATRIPVAPFEGTLPTQNPTSATVPADRGTSSILNSTETTVLVSLLAPLGVLLLLGCVILFRRRNRFLAAAVANQAEGVDEDAVGALSLRGASNSVGKMSQSRIV